MMARPKPRTVLIALVLFLMFFALRFPYRNIRGWLFGQVYKASGIRVDAEDLSLTFLGWPGIKLHKSNVEIPVGASSAIELAAEQVTARVGIGGLFPPAPSLSLYAYKFSKGGNLYVKGAKARSYIAGSLEAEDLNLIQFLKAGLPQPIEGILRASGSFNYDQTDLARSTGDFSLTIKKLNVPGMNAQGIITPAITWDQVVAKLAVKNGILEITECNFGTPQSELRGTLTGNIRLGTDFPSSYINVILRVKMTPTYKADPQSATLVSFLNTYESSKTPGEYALKWSANIRDMGMNIMAALPTKAE